MSSFKSLTRRPATRQFVRNYLLDYSGGRRRPTRARKTTRNKYTYIHGRHNNSNSNNKTTRLKNNHDSRVFIHVLEHSCVRALFFFCVHCGIVKPLGRGCCKSATHNGHEIHMSRGMRRSMAGPHHVQISHATHFGIGCQGGLLYVHRRSELAQILCRPLLDGCTPAVGFEVYHEAKQHSIPYSLWKRMPELFERQLEAINGSLIALAL
jgi:hypothetical protein